MWIILSKHGKEEYEMKIQKGCFGEIWEYFELTSTTKEVEDFRNWFLWGFKKYIKDSQAWNMLTIRETSCSKV